MTNDTLVLSGTDLSRFVRDQRTEKDRAALKNLDEQLDRIWQGKIDGEILPAELMPLQKLFDARADLAYPGLDLTFLRTPGYASFSDSSMKKYQLQVPRFVVNRVFSPSGFAIQLYLKQSGLVRTKYELEVMMSASDDGSRDPYHGNHLVTKKPIPAMFGDNLIFGMIDVQPKKVARIDYWKNPYKICDGEISTEGFKRIGKAIGYLHREKFRAPLNLLIPNGAKQDLRQARRSFSKDELYFISEARPEDWNAERVTADPLIVGIKETKGKAYLVGQFEMTGLEREVADEFLKT